MKTYTVGGYVRDQLLGVNSKDRDYVVVGATPKDMIDMGYQQVGASFPVYLHPLTGEEYALARTERKIGEGYHGFDVAFDTSVTLEQDLIRRDLTINAMAIDPDTGEIIDPYGGQQDLSRGILRHVSQAFAEDPVRILRTARFAARYNFTVADDTIELMRKVAPELNTVPQERILAEFEKGLSEKYPKRMFDVLWTCDAFDVDALAPWCWGSSSTLHTTSDVTLRLAMVCTGMSDTQLETMRIPSHIQRLVRAWRHATGVLGRYGKMSPEEKVILFDRLRAFSDRDTYQQAIKLQLCTMQSSKVPVARDMGDDLIKSVQTTGSANLRNMLEAIRLFEDVELACNIDARLVATQATVEGRNVKQAIFQARVEALASHELSRSSTDGLYCDEDVDKI